MNESPSRHDDVTITCPVCHHPFTANGRRRFCTDACRAAAYRRRRDANQPPIPVPASRPRRPITVYECDDCSTFMRRIGYGGNCPSCDEPVAITELLHQGGHNPDLT